MATASKVLSIAAGEIGYSRWDDPQAGTKYGRWYAELTKSSYFGQSGVPYCAMFVAWVLAQAGQSAPGMPTAAVKTCYDAAKSQGRLRGSKKDAKPGDLVIFDWGDGGKAQDHIGFVEKNCGSYIQTIEGNTSSGSSGSQGNGGGVYRRTRSWGVVYAIVAMQYDGSESTGTSTVKLTVDGSIGPESTKALQADFGTVQDGVISRQSTSDKAAHERLKSITYGTGGSDLARALQNFLRGKGYDIKADRYIGEKTATALQQWMRDELGYTKHAVDGIIGPNTASNIQNAHNAGAFRV